MPACQQCGKQVILILNMCAECDPELHVAWNQAIASAIDYETVTPEIERVYELVQDRVINSVNVNHSLFGGSSKSHT